MCDAPDGSRRNNSAPTSSRSHAPQVSRSSRRVISIETHKGRVAGVTLDDGTRIDCGAVVDAAGPMLDKVAGMMGELLPVHSEAHHKVGFRDTLGVIPRNAGLLIWNDTQRVAWSSEERVDTSPRKVATICSTKCPLLAMVDPKVASDRRGCSHCGEYRRIIQEPVWPLPEDPLYGEVVMRGLAAMFPGMSAYADRMPQRIVDGGYYTKTIENRPLAGPMQTKGAFVAGALSGFGIMASCGIAELVAAHITEAPLPNHAAAFMLDRYEDPRLSTRAGDADRDGTASE